jgi:hypothetical protein
MAAVSTSRPLPGTWAANHNSIGYGFPVWRPAPFAPLAHAWAGYPKRRRVQFQLAVDQPEIAVTVMQGLRMRRVAEPDHLNDVFQRDIDEADLAVLRVAQLCLVASAASWTW